MTETDRKQRKKNFSTQTVRVPHSIEKVIGHRLVDTGESFQGFIMRLIKRELSSEVGDVNFSGAGDITARKSLEIERLLKDNPKVASLYPWGDMLVRILTSDQNTLENREAVDAAQTNLRVLYRHIGGDPDGDFPPIHTPEPPKDTSEKRPARTDRAKKPPATDRKAVPAKT